MPHAGEEGQCVADLLPGTVPSPSWWRGREEGAVRGRCCVQLWAAECSAPGALRKEEAAPENAAAVRDTLLRPSQRLCLNFESWHWPHIRWHVVARGCAGRAGGRTSHVR